MNNKIVQLTRQLTKKKETTELPSYGKIIFFLFDFFVATPFDIVRAHRTEQHCDRPAYIISRKKENNKKAVSSDRSEVWCGDGV